ncbi:MAG: sulfatase-like hydrolase/transferase [Opitutus sp.]|nr:sulfatase-like hydrolase/transferase [Opitutus sp.]MCS6247877.1 sulfatase-like hydrolase/transferase [Opitutus sp.]MCS6275091.1 sulfatase-like hydrolase/transferase [Opitutus sp.]MCS6276293.1 sulfatase-like hydrolase/transferase [Opitutus sp.]MCS6301387.1 sulfatase-like hydrolase/transferase [Opitutus sp.]
MAVASAPSILWIVTTQWRAQACGYAGDPNARTPDLDALAARSINYLQAVTPHPFGPFSRAALLTGVRSPENGVRNYYDPLPLGARTIAHELNEIGYHTAFFGKWHLHARDPAAPLVGEAHARAVVPAEARGGFAFWEGFESGFLLNDPWLHGTRLAEPTPFFGYQSDVVCSRAAEWISCASKQRAEGVSPWFAVVSLEAPHPPYDAPAAGVAPRPVTLPANVPRGGEVAAKASRELAGYYAHIEATDRAIGRLLAVVPEEVIVVFTSVHGDMHGAHGLFRKGWPHEESVRVPLLVRGAVGGRRSDEPVSLIDLPAMTLAWARGQAWVCGRERAEISMPSVVALPLQCDRAWTGWRSAKRKEIFNADGSPWLSFDLRADPGEAVNLNESPSIPARPLGATDKAGTPRSEK